MTLAAGIGGAAMAAPSVISQIDLSKPFSTSSPWMFSATQGPEVDDPVFSPGGDQIPGAITLCLRKTMGSCDPALQTALDNPATDANFSAPHYLDLATIVYPRGKNHPPLFMVRTESNRSADGGHNTLTQMLAYDRAADRFQRIYAQDTSSNNDQEVRFIASGRLQGDIISAEPTADAPFGFWITVHVLSPAYVYRQVLRYRSATRYGDGNPLPVIDSEMPGIQRRLGLLHPGQPLPLPAGCSLPRLVHGELWCGTGDEQGALPPDVGKAPVSAAYP